MMHLSCSVDLVHTRLSFYLGFADCVCNASHKCIVKMQLHCLEKNGKQFTKMVSYCAYHRYYYVFKSFIYFHPKLKV